MKFYLSLIIDRLEKEPHVAVLFDSDPASVD